MTPKGLEYLGGQTVTAYSSCHLTAADLEVYAQDVRARDTHTDDEAVDVRTLGQLVLDTLAHLHVSRGRIDLMFVDQAQISDLNLEHMGQSGPTDVLSFPLDSPGLQTSGEVPVHLGDVMICPAVARAQAREHMGSEAGEFALLTIHGVLHILGHDHAAPDETRVMQQLERTLLATLGFAHPDAP